MKRTTLTAGLTLLPLCLAASAYGQSTQPSATSMSASSAKQCWSDLSTFERGMEKDGYWTAMSGYGYPMDGAGYAGNTTGPIPGGYENVRPGYEVRTLVASANVLARHGRQQACESTLSTARDLYKTYASDMRSGHVPAPDLIGWRKQQVAAAQPVGEKDTSFRSDQLLGADVRTPKNEAIGSVDDIVLSPKTGKVAYLIISRGGILGIGADYVPIPWQDFKITPNGNLLVLDTTKDVMDKAPQVKSDKFGPNGNFDEESQKVDAYWKQHIMASE